MLIWVHQKIEEGNSHVQDMMNAMGIIEPQYEKNVHLN
jgi:hypothetical protein